MARDVRYETLANHEAVSDKQDAIRKLRNWLAGFNIHTLARHYTRPIAPHIYIQVSAAHDGFIHKESARLLHEAFQGSAVCDLRWISGGHVAAFIIHVPTLLAATVYVVLTTTR